MHPADRTAEKSIAQRLAAVGLGYRYDGNARGPMIFVSATGEELGRFHVLLPCERAAGIPAAQ